MSWQDRHYNQEGTSSSGFVPTGKRSVVLWLLGINVVIWLLDQIFTGSNRGHMLSPFYWFNYNFDQTFLGLQIWRLLTYQFVHSISHFIHIFFNMMILLFLGPMAEQWWGSKRFLAFYLLCGVSGAIVMTILSFIPGLLPQGIYLIGASGSIYGIIVGIAVINPNQIIRMLWLPFEFKMKTFCYILIGIALLKIGFGSMNAGGEAAHLGGAVLGFFLVKRPSLLNWADRMSPQAIQAGYNKGKFERKVKKEQASREEVDRILAKVSEKGLQSLTSREKKILKQDSDRLRDR